MIGRAHDQGTAAGDGGTSSRRAGFWLSVGLFLLLGLTLLSGGFYLFSAQRDAVERQARENLVVTARFKASAIGRWVNERKSDARALSQRLTAMDGLATWLRDGRPDDARARQLREHLRSLHQFREYRDIALADVDGDALLSAGGNIPAYGAELSGLIRDAANARRLELSVDHPHIRASAAHTIYICMPVFDKPGTGSKVIAVVVLDVDPRLNLLSFIKGWPGPSPSSETYMIERYGDAARFINTPRLSGTRLDDEDVPGPSQLLLAAAARGGDGFVQRQDYRGIDVLTALSPVPGTPWYVVADVDAAEVYAPIRRLGVTYAILVFSLVAATGFLSLAARHRREIAHLSARLLADQKRLEMAQRYEFLSKNANDIILLVDADGKVEEANDRAILAYGYARGEIIGRPLNDLVAPAGNGGTEQPQTGGSEGETGAIFESVHRRRDGTLFPVEISARHGEMEERSWRQLIVRDITERKQAENALRASEKRLRQITSTIDEVFWVNDLATGAFVYVNAAFERLTGISVAAVLNDRNVLFNALHEADRERVVQARAEAILRREPYSIEYRFVRLDGTPRWVWSRGYPVVEPDGTVRDYLGVAQDITERKDSEQRQAEQGEALHTALEQGVEALASAMLHRDFSSAGHGTRTRDLAVEIGKRLGLGGERLEGLSLAAVIHDIGQIQTPAEIINRPRRLGVEEFDLVKLHAEAGYDILKDITFPWPLAQIIRQHHENVDGTGYPLGIAGDEILLEARIIRVADSVDAMLSHRPFRRAYDRAYAVAELRKYAGTWFDPDIVNACLRVLGDRDQQTHEPRKVRMS